MNREQDREDTFYQSRSIQETETGSNLKGEILIERLLTGIGINYYTVQNTRWNTFERGCSTRLRLDLAGKSVAHLEADEVWWVSEVSADR